MSNDSNRMLLEFEQQLRIVNREVLNPLVEEITVDDLCPVIRMVANARGAYLTELITIAKTTGGEMPADPQIKSLQQYRIRYDQLVAAAQALETAIQRGYLDVKPGEGKCNSDNADGEEQD